MRPAGRLESCHARDAALVGYGKGVGWNIPRDLRGKFRVALAVDLDWFQAHTRAARHFVIPASTLTARTDRLRELQATILSAARAA